ncbi:MAG: hypothetical protein IT164_12880 [Bryobacterales bacterium]|nr:hypothetical protein [Bryobacterales bacterium]
MLRALLLLLSSGSALLPGAEVRGVVRDAVSGEALARVDVAVQGGASSRTDSSGAFFLEAEAGSALVVSTVGYRPERVAVKGGEALEVWLVPDVLRRSESLEVKELGDEPEPVGARTMSGLEFQNTASVIVNDPLRSVQSLPGVVGNDEFQSQFALRGAEFRRIGLIMDGVLLHSPFHTVAGDATSASATLFGGDILEGVTLYEGPLPASVSDRTAGAVAMTTRSGARDRVRGRGSVSMSNVSGLAEGPLGKRGAWLVAARKSYLQYLIDRLSDDDSIAFAFSDAESRVDYDLTARQRVRLSLLYGTSGLNREKAIGRSGLNSIITSDYDFTLVSLGHTWAVTPGWLAEHRGAWIDERWENRNRESLNLGDERYGEWVFSGDHTVRSGMWGVEGGFSARRLRGGGEALVRRNPPLTPLVAERYRGTGVRTGVYAAPSVRLLDRRLTLRAAARWDKHDVSGQTAASPGASVAFAPWNRLRLSAGWGAAAQFAELSQFYGLGGGTALLAERSQHAQAQGELALTRTAGLRVSYWRRWDRDLLFAERAQAYLLNGRVIAPLMTPLWRNRLRMAARGAEVTLTRKSANALSGWISYGWTDAPVCCGLLGERYPADFEQRHTVNVFGNYRVRPSVNLSGRYSYGSGTPLRGYFRGAYPDLFLTDRRNLLRLPEYQRLDVRANKTFQRDRVRWMLFVEVVNVTGRENLRVDDLSGFNAVLGTARVRLEKTFPVLPSVGLAVEF